MAYWYLDTEHGNDENDGTTPQSAKRTQNAVEALAMAGDTIWVAPPINPKTQKPFESFTLEPFLTDANGNISPVRITGD